MNRKWITSIAAMTAASLALAVAGLATAGAQDESPLAKLMEKVNKSNNALRNAVKTPVAYKKAGPKAVLDEAETLIQLGKEAREFPEPAKEQKKTQKEWTDAMDVMIKALTDLTEVVKADKDGSAAPKAKDAHKAVAKSCSDCHAIFRVDE